MQLSPADQRELRDAAAYAWRQSGGRYLRSAAIFAADSRVKTIAKLDPATIILIVQLAYKLWSYWRRNKVSEPSVVAVAGEPVFGGAE